MKRKPVALACSDIHLCHTRPSSRIDNDWYEAMARYLHQLDEIASYNQIPVLCAGDVFDRWSSPPELINFAIRNLPTMWAVPGQHDLPHHSLVDVHKSGFWTLVEAGVVKDCQRWTDGLVYTKHGVSVRVHFVPWGCELKPLQDPQADELDVLVAHRYVWMRGSGYPGASKSEMAGNLPKALDGVDVAVFGDNHKTFDCRMRPGSSTIVVNPGCLIPRAKDECGKPPVVYLINNDGSVDSVPLDCSKDEWSVESVEGGDVEVDGMDEFLDELRDLESDTLDFREAVRRWCKDNEDERVVEMVMQSIGER